MLYFFWRKKPMEAKVPIDHKSHKAALCLIICHFPPPQNCLSFSEKSMW